MFNASQRNSLKDGFQPIDPTPAQQHYQNNRGPGVFRPTSPPKSMNSSRQHSPSFKGGRILNFKKEENQDFNDPKKLQFKYKKRGPQPQYHHYPNLYLDGGSASFPYNPRSGKNPMVIAPQNLT